MPKDIVTCQVHSVSVKRVQCTVRLSFLNFWVALLVSFILSLPGARVVRWWFVGDPTLLTRDNMLGPHMVALIVPTDISL